MEGFLFRLLKKVFAGAKCFARQAVIESWKVELGSCWVIGPISGAKEDRHYCT